jgi:hypothetical protein
MCSLEHSSQHSRLLAGFVSGSADHELKFWEWQLTTGPVADGGGGGSTPSRRLGIRHTRTLKMTDDVLCVRISPDGKHVPLPVFAEHPGSSNHNPLKIVAVCVVFSVRSKGR